MELLQNFQASPSNKFYQVKKTVDSLIQRTKIENFVPPEFISQKTELGLHDLSAQLINPGAEISVQQYKTPDRHQVYAFMPQSSSKDQAPFKCINDLAKTTRLTNTKLYNRVQDIRASMTRVKLAAAHDMATPFVHVGNRANGSPKRRSNNISDWRSCPRCSRACVVGHDDIGYGYSWLCDAPAPRKRCASFVRNLIVQ